MYYSTAQESKSTLHQLIDGKAECASSRHCISW